MAFDVKEFMESGLACGGQRPTLFEVIFHDLEQTDQDILRLLCDSVKYKIKRNGTKVIFSFYEREDGFVSKLMLKLNGPVSVCEYSRTGVISNEHQFTFHWDEIRTTLGWDMSNSLKKWIVKGYIK